jgi:hypothetical protein
MKEIINLIQWYKMLMFFILVSFGEIWLISPAYGGNFTLDDQLIYNTTRLRSDQSFDNSFYQVLELNTSEVLNKWQYKFDLSDVLEHDGSNNQLPLDLNQALYFDNVKFYINEAWINSAFFDIGKEKWTWGYGYSFSPTYPLDKDTAYWGAQMNYSFSNVGFSLGAAYDNDNKGNIDEFGAGWLRAEFKSSNQDYDFGVTYREDDMNQEYWNYCAEISQDLQNGWEIYSGYDLSNIKNCSKGLVGFQFSGPNSDWIVEYYHNEDNFLFVDCNNTSAIFQRWQWEIQTNINLGDFGKYYKLNIKYVNFPRVTPELIIENFGGPKDSMIAQDSRDFIYTILVTIRLVE